jgi:hypothetical protein
VEDALVERGYDVHARLPGDFFDLHHRWIEGIRSGGGAV